MESVRELGRGKKGGKDKRKKTLKENKEPKRNGGKRNSQKE